MSLYAGWPMYGVFWITPPHTAATSVDDAFDQQDRACRIAIARHRRRFGVVDAADHRRDRDGDRQRHVMPRGREPVDEGERRPRQRERPGGSSLLQWRGRVPQLARDRVRSEPRQHRNHDRGKAVRQFHLADQRDENHAERDHSADRLGEDLDERKEHDEADRDGGKRAQQCRARQRAPQRVAEERRAELRDAHDDHHRHPDRPGPVRIARGNVCGTDDAEGQREQRRRVDAERHCADVLAALATGEAKREPRVEEVADEDAERGARNHATENDVGRHAEDADENARHRDEQRHVVDRQREKSVDVAACVPAVAERRLRGTHSGDAAAGAVPALTLLSCLMYLVCLICVKPRR